MSPLRRKGRGGEGGRIMASRPSLAAVGSPDPLVPLKLTRERRASTTQLHSSSKSKQLRADYAPLSRVSAANQAKADQARISTTDQGQARTVSDEDARGISTSEARASSVNRARIPAAEHARASSLGELRTNAAEQSKGLAMQVGKASSADKARASSATRSRVSSVENFRSLIASSRCVPVTADVSSGTQGTSRRMSTKLRAESRPRSNRASLGMSASGKHSSEKLVNESTKVSAFGLLTRSKLSSNAKEESKKVAKASVACPGHIEINKVDSSSEKAPNREPLRNLKEASIETSRTSTSSLSLSAQSSRKGTPGDAFQDGGMHTKPGQSNRHAIQHGRLSTGSFNLTAVSNDTKNTCDVEAVNSRVLLKRRNEQYVANESRAYGLVNELRPEASNNLSTYLHKRLALLEGKVSKLASEIQKTRQMLTNDGLADNADVLTDIQDKITSMERFMSFNEINKDARSVDKDVSMEDQLQIQQATENIREFRPPLEFFIADKRLESFQVPVVSEHEFYFKHNVLQGSVSAPPKVSRSMYDSQQEEIVYHPRALLRNWVPLQGNELNSSSSDVMQLQNTRYSHPKKPTADMKENRTSCDLTEEQVPCRKMSSPAKMNFNEVNCLQSKASNRVDPIQHTNLPENRASFQCGHHGPGQVACAHETAVRAEETKDTLECSESPLSNSFLENVENAPPDDGIYFDINESLPNQLHPIGEKVATAGWYVSEGESILLAHDDGSCSYYDVANMDEKSVYAAPSEMASTLWSDCWLIRAAGSDGRSNKYIVATTAGNAVDCGFCSWEFSSKRLAACHMENQTTPPRGSSPGSPIQRSRNFRLQMPSVRSTMNLLPSAGRMLSGEKASSSSAASSMQMPYTLHHSATTYQTDCCDSPQWWYGPCGPLMASAASSLKVLVLYDIRDGDAVMGWESGQPIASLDYTSPLQWRDKGKLALAEDQAISVWDVSTMDTQCLQYVHLPGKRISAFHVHNRDAECSGGVRQRLSSSETEAYDGVCCTQSDISILDFRVANGVGISFPVSGQDMQSVYARGDMIFVGGLNKESCECGVHQWSLRKGLPVRACAFPASSSHYTHLALTQVWGSSRMVMAVNGNGLYVFQGWKEAMEGLCDVEDVKDVIGTQDLLNPSFDYSNSRVLLISRDRQANWSYWPQHWAMA